MSDLPVDTDNKTLPAADDEADDEELFVQLRGWYRIDRDHSHDWRVEARQAYDFVSGNQWTDEERAMLREQLRPDTTFNRIQPMVKIVSGLEAGNRQEIAYSPREIGDASINELLTGAAQWVRDGCDAEDEESDAFVDCVVVGLGWCDTVLRYDEEPEGKLYIERIDPLEMYWDAGANKKNLDDARRLFRVKDVPLYEALEMFPDVERSELHASWADDVASKSDQPHDATEAPFYRNDQSQDQDRQRKMVRLVECQWWEYRDTWRVFDPVEQKEVQLDDGSMSLLKERMGLMGRPEPVSVRQRTRYYRRAMLGANGILAQWDGPAKGGFTWKCLTGDRDRKKGLFYGIVRAMIDPQRWANKWMSQIMHIMNTGAKGGIIAEKGAFSDIREAEEDWADPAAIVEAEAGAIREQKIMPRPVNQMPSSLPDLLTLAISSIRDCTGINLELLGLVERDQPGILENMRKQAGMTVLAGLFNSLRRYRKNQGVLLLWFISNFLSDGRLIRIGGQQQAKYVPLLRQEGVAEYDVIVDDAPNSTNIKEQAWGALIQLMPMLRGIQIPPQVYLELLRYSPLPATIVDKIEQIMQSQPPKSDPVAMLAQSEAQTNMARAALMSAQAQKAQTEAAMAGSELQLEMQKLQSEAGKSAMEAEEVRARVENLRAQAMANLAKAGAVKQDAQTNQLLAVLDVLDGVVNWHFSDRQMGQAERQLTQAERQSQQAA